MSSKRCASCDKKIRQIDEIMSKCRCGNIYCIMHRVDHNCDYDYKRDYHKNNNLFKLEAEKVSKI